MKPYEKIREITLLDILREIEKKTMYRLETGDKKENVWEKINCDLSKGDELKNQNEEVLLTVLKLIK